MDVAISGRLKYDAVIAAAVSLMLATDFVELLYRTQILVDAPRTSL